MVWFFDYGVLNVKTEQFYILLYTSSLPHCHGNLQHVGKENLVSKHSILCCVA